MCFLFKQKTAYEMRISDWSSDVCSSDLKGGMDIQTTLSRGSQNGLGEDQAISGDYGHVGLQRGECSLHVRILQADRGADLQSHRLRSRMHGGRAQRLASPGRAGRLTIKDRKSTRLNSSH